jgi:hypothetical protein
MNGHDAESKDFVFRNPEAGGAERAWRSGKMLTCHTKADLIERYPISLSLNCLFKL